MSYVSKVRLDAIEKLRNYNGPNPHILKLKRDIIVLKKVSLLSDFDIEYINNNYNRQPMPIGKTLKIADWYGDKLREEYSIEFRPEKMKFLVFLGETKSTLHCVIRYRQNMEPMDLFVPKSAILGNLFVRDYHEVKVDFDRYDRLSLAKDPNRKLKPHQKEGVQFLLDRKKCILADDMGLGKSMETAVAAIEGNFDAILIICPASLKTNWKKELLWYVPERDITIIDTFNGKTKPELEKFLGYREGKSGLSLDELKKEADEMGKWKENRFIIINYDILNQFYEIPATRSAENIKKALENSPILQYISNKKSLIIIDEAHRLSKKDSIRYKIIRDLIKRGNPDSVYLLTGTMITNNPENLYCILNLIEDDVTGNWQFYVDRYCAAMKIPAKGEKEKWTNIYLSKLGKSTWFQLSDDEKEYLKKFIRENARMITITSGSSNLEELKDRISHIYLRRIKNDISDNLPNKTVHEMFYDFDIIQMMEYEKLWEEYEAAQMELDPTKAINKDLLEGAVYRKYCSDQMVPNTIKLADSFIENGEKVIIATCFDDELNTLKDYYGEKCVIYNGKMTAKQKDVAQYEFMTNPDIKVFIGQVIAAGVGLTLVSSHRLIFNNMPYVPSDCRQMEDRIYRIGQTHDVDIYYQMFRGTQYEKIWNTVMRKELVINQVIKTENEK